MWKCQKQKKIKLNYNYKKINATTKKATKNKCKGELNANKTKKQKNNNNKLLRKFQSADVKNVGGCKPTKTKNQKKKKEIIEIPFHWFLGK